nr:IS30 family transposase [Veillonella caviae]
MYHGITFKHLNLEECFYLEKRILAGDSITSIAKALGRSRTTLYAELKRGTVEQRKQNKHIHMYLVDYGQLTYENTRQYSFNTLKVSQIESFLSWVEAKVLKDKWSFDAAVGYAIRNSLFVRNEMVCTKTLYNYLHQGLLRVKAMDLPGIICQSQKKRHTREHKRKLGKSIDLRDKSIDSRKEFGHWELDTLRGIKNRNDQVLVSLLGRKTRIYIALRCPSLFSRRTWV